MVLENYGVLELESNHKRIINGGDSGFKKFARMVWKDVIKPYTYDAFMEGFEEGNC